MVHYLFFLHNLTSEIPILIEKIKSKCQFIVF